MNVITVLLVDPQCCVRQAIHHKLTQEPDVVVVAETDALAQLSMLARNTTPQIAIVDITLLDKPGYAACRESLISCSQTALIFLSPVDWDVYLFAAWQVGASAFVVKTCTMDELLQMVRAVAGAGQA